MPQKFENLPPNWDDIEAECQHVSLSWPWTITSGDETPAVIITSLEWTFNDDFWIRVTAYPEGSPKFSKRIDINKHHSWLESLSEAFSTSPEPAPTSYSWRIIRLLILRRYNPQNGQCSSSLFRLGTGQILWHRPRPGCRSIHPLNRVQDWFCSRNRTTRGWCRTCYLSFQKESLIFLITKRTSSRKVWEYFSRYKDLEWSSNSVHQKVFRWKKQIQTEWKLNIVYEQMEQRFETFFTE